MIFRSKSNVKNHVSTTRSLFAHKIVDDETNQSVTKPLQNEEHLNDRSPPPRVEEPEVIQSPNREPPA